jgi:hypothetical protein
MKKSKPKVKEKRNEETFDYMKTNKDNIKNIIRDERLLPLINDLTIRTNKIVIHSYQFLKLYLIHLYENNQPFPEINKEFICDIFKVVTKRKSNTGGYTEKNMPDQLRCLTEFYKNYYSLTIVDDEIIYYDKLPYILAYEAIDMLTNINNNIQEHFIDHLNKYVNITFDVKSKRDDITKNNKDKVIRKQLHKELYDEINKVKKDLTSFNDLTSDVKYHYWIKEQKIKLFPNKTKFEENNIYYELKSNSQYFLLGMFYICNELERINMEKIKNNKKQIRLFNVIPLRTNITPKNICIDTCGIIQNFMGEDYDSKLLATYKKQNEYFNIWNKYFKLNKPVFKKGKYVFSNIIRTDGVSCCILFIRVDENKKPLSKTLQNKKCCQEENINYIENACVDDIKHKKIVVADPNHSDLIYCGYKDINNNLITFRYTQNQRRLETRMKKYSKIKDKLNKETIINEKSVKELETCLSSLNSKVCDYDKFKVYCIEKNKLNNQLYLHYEQRCFRKFKLNAFTNTQKSESKMVKNFKNKYGTPDETIFVMGDYDKGDYNMKGKEPVICKKFRRIFRNAGYKTFLINEFRTSKLCNCCHNEIEYFLEKPSKKPKLKRECKTEICHGLLRCQSVKHKSEIFHNRDKNAVQNMLNIVKSILEKGKRPDIFCRATNS